MNNLIASCFALCVFFAVTSCDRKADLQRHEGVVVIAHQPKSGQKTVRFVVINHSNKAICVSTLNTGARVRGDVLAQVSGPEKAFPIEPSSVGANGPDRPAQNKEIRIEPGKSLASWVNVLDKFGFQAPGAYEFDVSVPVFPCGFQEMLGVTRRWEQEFGPNYLSEKGVSFLKSEPFALDLSDIS